MTDEQKGVVIANVADQQSDMNKQFAALAKEIKDKLAQDMDDIKSTQEPLSAAQGHVHMALNSTKKMPVTPEEHQELEIPSGPSHKSPQCCTRKGGWIAKKSSNVLAAIDEINATASLTLDVIKGTQEDCLDEEDALPELTDDDDSDSEDGFLDQKDYEIAEHHLRKLGESKPEAEATFCDDKLHTRSNLAELLPSCMSALLPCCFGVVPSRNGCQDGVAGTISVEGYEKLKKVTGAGTERGTETTNEPDCNWDLLCGTGPMMNSLKLSLDLFKSMTTCWAGVRSKGDQPVTLPLARPSV
ncbi:hypothetical protein CYMTET_39156 [Cymbomonas tetramitiformis]|uniref:Uncharacterized protein n=1 Tax=Cymbomonas tetramitiformis TaxID=36881 RepID=A0AAE0CAL3_9CHLO|nr:hypothetical protein CYMTET_39156 [Cymbomonas tetramitiformis]